MEHAPRDPDHTAVLADLDPKLHGLPIGGQPHQRNLYPTRYRLDMMALRPTFLYLGCAALLIAAVMLRLPPKIRAGLFTVMILTTIAGGQNQRIERVATEVLAAAD